MAKGRRTVEIARTVIVGERDGEDLTAVERLVFEEGKATLKRGDRVTMSVAPRRENEGFGPRLTVGVGVGGRVDLLVTQGKIYQNTQVLALGGEGNIIPERHGLGGSVRVSIPPGRAARAEVGVYGFEWKPVVVTVRRNRMPV